MAGGGGNECSCGESLLVDVSVGLVGWMELRKGGHDFLHCFALSAGGVHVQDERGSICLKGSFYASANDVNGGLLNLALDGDDIDGAD